MQSQLNAFNYSQILMIAKKMSKSINISIFTFNQMGKKRTIFRLTIGCVGKSNPAKQQKKGRRQHAGHRAHRAAARQSHFLSVMFGIKLKVE